MFRLLADHDLHDAIIRELLRRLPDLDIVRLRDYGEERKPDPEVLALAADENRIVLTHDRNTMTRYANERVVVGRPMRGLFVIEQTRDIGRVLRDLLAIMDETEQSEWENLTVFLPFPG